MLIGLVAPDQGSAYWRAKLVGSALSLRELRRHVQMVFQDSYASLNPRLTVEDTIAFGPKVHGIAPHAARNRARDLLSRVGLDPALFAGRFPHELSGGQRQRVNIGRALAIGPQLLILDEAVSALDKSVEAQVLNLLLDIKDEFGLTYLFISHDLSVVRFISDRVVVMYLGEIVEIGPVDALWTDARHPYTSALLAAMPSLDPEFRGRKTRRSPETLPIRSTLPPAVASTLGAHSRKRFVARKPRGSRQPSRRRTWPPAI